MFIKITLNVKKKSNIINTSQDEEEKWAKKNRLLWFAVLHSITVLRKHSREHKDVTLLM
jgi:hypothetical protein